MSTETSKGDRLLENGVCVWLRNVSPKELLTARGNIGPSATVPTMPALGRWSPDDQKFEASPNPSWATNDPAFKKKTCWKDGSVDKMLAMQARDMSSIPRTRTENPRVGRGEIIQQL